jgi:methyltransferase (TIGR00027 family)
LAEGLLMYLPADAQDRLFEQLTELSAAGSRVAAETVGPQAGERRERMRSRLQQLRAKFGIEDTVDVAELMYNDADRADVAEWLDAHGWTASSVTSQDEMRRLDRAVQVEAMQDSAFSSFVTGRR